jgi:hypothetical protein
VLVCTGCSSPKNLGKKKAKSGEYQRIQPKRDALAPTKLRLYNATLIHTQKEKPAKIDAKIIWDKKEPSVAVQTL